MTLFCVKKHHVAVSVLIVSVLVKLACVSIQNKERVIHLTLECSGDQCTATINGKSRLTAHIGSTGPGARIGLYVFHPCEKANRRQYFRDLIVRTGKGTHAVCSEFGLTRPEKDGARFSGGNGWRIETSKGMIHRGKEEERSVTLIRDFEARDFCLDVDLVDVVDAGVVFWASDPGNGIVFVIRPGMNDAFFFPLEGGVPGAIINVIPLKEMRAWEELFRLAGLLADIFIRAFVFLAVIWIAIGCLPAIPVRKQRHSALFTGRGSQIVLLVIMFAVTFIALALMSRFSFHAIPHIVDETAYLFQAKIFADGRLWVRMPELPEFFQHEHIIMMEGRWFSKYPPMFSAILALGVKAGAYWLVNPVLGAITALAIFLIAKEVFDIRCALITWILTLSSPFFLFMGANLMSHMGAAMFVSLFLLFAICGLREGKVGFFTGAGACLGAALLTRPYTAFLASIPVLVYFGISWFRSLNRKGLNGCLVAFAVGLYPFALIYLAWHVMYSSAGGEIAGLYSLYDSTDSLGFGALKGTGQSKTWGSWGHSPAKAFRSIYLYLDNISHYLFGWPWKLSLGFIAVPFLCEKRRPVFVLILAVFLSLVVGHVFYWATQHIGYGARYWFSGFPSLAVLSGVGIGLLMQEASKKTRSSRNEKHYVSAGPILVGALVGVLIFWNLIFYFPSRFDEGHDYANISDQLKREVERRGLHNAIIFVHTEGLARNDGFFMNDPVNLSDRIFARDLGERNWDLLELYPGYKGYTWNKKTLVPM